MARARDRTKGNALTAAAKKRSNSSKSPAPSKIARTGSFNTQLKEAIEEVKSSASKKKTYTVDPELSYPGASVHKDYACMLNQTNINQNNNKFYVIQVILDKTGKKFSCFTRWGRVGESGQNNLENCKDVHSAIDSFKKKFKQKTQNDWEKRDNFQAKSGKYTYLDMGDSDEEEEESVHNPKKVCDSLVLKTQPSKLDNRTAIMIELIFHDDMFRSNMCDMNLDIKKMPLGKLSQAQIAKGLEALLDIETAIKAKKNQPALAELSSKFYTLIPHDFGRTVPPTITTQDVIDKKKQVMMTLSDIELTQNLKRTTRKALVNPIDENYNSLGCKLTLLNKSSKEYKLIEKYVNATKTQRKGWSIWNAKHKLTDVWTVHRNGESERIKTHDNIEYRKLLWHGTNISVIAAILNSGLRIMPHSGGCVGKGIYFGSEWRQSWGYVHHYSKTFKEEKNVGFMFLSEVALGNGKIVQDLSCSEVTKAPPGYDSIHARGQCEPIEAGDVKMKYDGREVIVPAGKSVEQKQFKNSLFYLSEYLVYKESQVKIRYLLKFAESNKYL